MRRAGARRRGARALRRVWFAENPFARGILPAAAACAVATRSLQIGAGVFNPFNRHPSLIAMEIGALDELAGGRVRLGIGSGIGSAVERMGLSYARPLTAVAEAVAIVRALLRGEDVTSTRARCFRSSASSSITSPRADIAIFMAGRGDASLRLAGEIADGLLLSNMCAPGFAARAAAVAQESRAGGRPRRDRRRPIHAVLRGRRSRRSASRPPSARSARCCRPTGRSARASRRARTALMDGSAITRGRVRRRPRTGCGTAKTPPRCSTRASSRPSPSPAPPPTAAPSLRPPRRPASPRWR